jgi:glycerate-2-kinase
MVNARSLAEKMLDGALKVVDPYELLQESIKVEKSKLIIQEKTEIDISQYAHIYVIGIGKGVAPMAKAMEELLGDRSDAGFISVKYEHELDLNKIKVLQAGHPIPDKNSLLAGEEMLKFAETVGENDLIIMLISGGGSSVMEVLPEGVSLNEIADLNKILISCGASIGEINTVRKAVSLVKGGKLAERIFPARILNFILSDVVGDSLQMIASAPTVIDHKSDFSVMDILQKYKLMDKISPAILSHIKEDSGESEKENDKIESFIVANNLRALREAERIAKESGYQTIILSDQVEGESREVAKMLSGVIKSIHSNDLPKSPPLCILLGGETTVTLKGRGKGGRNQEAVLAMFLAMGRSVKPFYFSSIGTDGSDGPTDAAGAWIDEKSYDKYKKMALNAGEFLKNNDSYHFFDKLGNLIKTGSTKTNVMDIMFIIIER